MGKTSKMRSIFSALCAMLVALAWTSSSQALSLTYSGPSGNFFSPGINLNGLNYGILSAGDNTGTGNTGVTGHGPLIKNSVAYTLTADTLFSLSELGSTVVFQYGTSITEPTVLGTCI